MLRYGKLVPVLGGCALVLASFAADARTLQLCVGRDECDKLIFDCGQDPNSIGGYSGDGDGVVGFCIFPR